MSPAKAVLGEVMANPNRGCSVLHDLLVMLFHDRTDSTLKIKAQKRKELVVERHRDVHIFDSDLYVVDGRFHGSGILAPKTAARVNPMTALRYE